MWFTPIFNTHKIHFESLRLSIIYTPFPQLCNVYIDNSKLILNVNLMLKCRCKKGGMANHYILFFYHFSSWYGFPRHQNVPQILSSDYNNVKLHKQKCKNIYNLAFEVIISNCCTKYENTRIQRCINSFLKFENEFRLEVVKIPKTWNNA